MRRWMASIAASLAVLAPTAGAILADARPSHAAGNTVEVDDSDRDPNNWKYVPADLTVPPGTTVTWHNGGQYSHTVKANDGSFDSGYIVPGAQWQHTFDKPGEYPYHCEPHPWKKGVVHVK